MILSNNLDFNKNRNPRIFQIFREIFFKEDLKDF